MNYCYNCKHHTKVSEEKIYCNLKCQFKWQDDECELHDLEITSNNLNNGENEMNENNLNNLPTVIQESYIRIFVDVMFKKFIENQIEAGFQEYQKRKHICINCDCHNICLKKPVRLMLQPCKNFN